MSATPSETTQKITGPPLLYAVEEAAAALSISRDLMYELIRSGRVVSITIGRRRLISHTALLNYIARMEENAA